MSRNGHVIDRPLPHNLDAERSVLGAILLDNKSLTIAASHVKPVDFFASQHRAIFLAMLAMAEAQLPIDLVTMTDQLRTKSSLDAAGGAAYLSALVDEVPRVSNIAYYARIISEKSRLRQLAHIAESFRNSALEEEESSGALLTELEQVVREAAIVNANGNGDVPRDLLEQSKWPGPPAAAAFHGLPGEIVRAIEPHSEADPTALLLQLLVGAGSTIGSGPFFTVEQHQHHVNLFTVIVGLTSKARKGTSWSRIAALFGAVDPFWTENRIHGGVASGEGIIWHVRDPILKGETLIDDGVQDKRLLLLESEFAQPLAVIERPGNTTSEILRRAWDGTALQTLTKNSSARATGAHISMIGHVTREELLRHLSQTEIANGLANRFIFCCAQRSKTLPEGSDLSLSQLSPLIERLRTAITFARGTGEMKRDPDARKMWSAVYPDLSEGKPGLFGAVTSRAEAQVLRLSMVYALLDCSAEIRCEHLQSALAMWNYAESSCRYIFGDALGDPVADEILRALRAKPGGLTRSEIRDLFGRHRSEAEIGRALGTLLQYRLANFRPEQTGGRPVERWFGQGRGCDKSDLSDQRGG